MYMADVDGGACLLKMNEEMLLESCDLAWSRETIGWSGVERFLTESMLLFVFG